MHSRYDRLAKRVKTYTELSMHLFSFWNVATVGIHHEPQQQQEDRSDFHKISKGDDWKPNSLHTLCKDCSHMQRGRTPFDYSAQRGLYGSVGNSLYNSSATAEELFKAQAMSSEFPLLNGLSWNGLITAYVEDGHLDKAITCVHQMQCYGLSPSAGTFTCILKLCASIDAMDKGQLVHAQLEKSGLLEKDVVVGTVLLDMYAKCGSLEKAREVFHKLPVQDIVACNVLIGGHIEHGLCKEALQYVDEMENKGLNPNFVTFACILKSCGIIEAAIKGHTVHAQIVRENLLGESILISNALVDMYAKCGLLESAQKVFHDMATRDVVSWNTLITAYTHCKGCDKAITCFERMQCEGLLPSMVTFACILKACGSLEELSKGRQVHAQSKQHVFVEKGKVLANALLEMYVNCGALAKAKAVFDNLRARDVVSWTLIVGGYAQDGRGEEAMIYFERMQCESTCPNVFTFVAVLSACGSTGASERAHKVHSQVSAEGLLEKDTVLSNALIDAYMKCGSFTRAQQVFNKLSSKDSISWNVLISGYAQHGHCEEALSYYKLMQGAGFLPDAFTFACICKVCGSLSAAYEGQQIHTMIVSHGLLERDVVTANSLIDMLAKCSMLPEAREIFNRLPFRDIVSWNSLIQGYTQHELFDEALRCFEQMWGLGITPDAFTFASIIKACSSLGASCKGQKIHADIARDGLLQIDMVLGNSLIGMYAAFGMLAEAQVLFDELPGCEVTSLNVLLTGYSQSGEDEIVFKSFVKLIEGNIKPDLATVSIVLDACIHTGLLDEGQMFFEIVNTIMGTILSLDHHICLIDLFGRTGRLDKAALIAKEMPFHANFTAWLTLLGACQNCRDVILGRWAFGHAAQLGEKDAAAHILMSNIYAVVDMHGSRK